MADFDTIKQEINVNIPDNNSQYITAKKVRDTLLDMIDDVDEAKQDALVSGTNIKTINGYTLLGSGDIVIEGGGDLSAYVSKEELSQMGYVTSNYLSQAGYVTNEYLSQTSYVTQSALNSASYVTSSDLDNMSYITASDVSQMGYVTSSALSNMSYATTSDLNNAIAGIDIPTYTSDLTNDSGFITASDLTGYATETYVADYVASHSGPIDLSAYVTKTELSSMGYITASDIPDMSSYATLTYLETYYATIQNVSDTANTMQQVLIDANIITVDPETGDMTVEEMATETYVADYVSTYAPTPDLSAYVTKTELSNASYVTASALSNMGYITSIPSEYITQTELSNMSYATTSQLSGKQDTLVSGTNIKTINNTSLLGSGNITISGSGSNISKVTQAEYDAMEQAGTLDPDTLYVITDAQTADLTYYVLKSELNSMSYVTQTALSNMSYATTSQLADKQDALVSGTNIKTINNTSLLGSGNITITGGSSISEVTQAEYDAMEQAGTLDPDIIYVITDAAPTDLSYYVLQSDLENMGYVTSTALSNMSYATTTQVNAKQDALVSGTNIKTINNESLLGSGNITIAGGGSTVTGVTQAQYDAMEQAGTLDPTVLYVITDATGADLSDYVTQTELSNAGYLTSIPNTYATYAAISNMGYLTSANFIYDSSTYTLTISI